MRAQVQRGGRGVHGRERRSMAWPGGEAAMAPRHAEAMMASECRGGRRARSSGAVMASSARSSAAAARQRAQRCSGAASPVLECPAARAQGGGKGEREGREKERVNVLTCVFLKIFHGNSKNFEHESCSKFKILQLSFQVKLHLSNNLKVNNLKSSLNEKPLNPLFFGVFSKFHVVT